MRLPFAMARRAAAKPRRQPRAARLRVEEHEIGSPLIDPRHDGLQIAHLSDLHVARVVRPRRLLKAIELVNARRPDLVLLTGDYVCTSARAVPRLTEALGALKVPAWATLGNHDHWTDARAVAEGLRRAGVRVLSNAHQTLAIGGAPLHLIGIDDHRTGNADCDAAFRGVGRGGTRLAFTHDPNAADALGGREVALALAGHTHGGQILLPRLTAAFARQIGVKYLAGFFALGPTLLYVNRGLGAAVPVRVAAPTEVAFFTLRHAAAPARRSIAS